MSMLNNTAELTAAWRPRALAALRIVSALTFLAHGVVKVAGYPDGAQPGQQELISFLGIVGLVEIVAGVLLIVGLFTRPVAFLMSGMMAVAYWMFHFPSGPLPIANGGEAAILYCFIFLYLTASGAGAWSLDGLRKR